MAERTNHEGYPDPTAYAALTHVEQDERLRRRQHAKDFLSEASRLDKHPAPDKMIPQKRFASACF